MTNALTQIAASGVYYGTSELLFPIAFANANYVVAGNVKYSTGFEVPLGFSPNTAAKATIRVYDFYCRPASDTLYVCRWIAIGRWK